MRPQHITAENAPGSRRPSGRRRGFNEAAAYHCGKPSWTGISTDTSARRFNEAAAYHCGKLVMREWKEVEGGGFNEAAAYHCGKRGALRGVPAPARASMRPQHITAENGQRHRSGSRVSGVASMRPQHITAENSSPPRTPDGGGDGFNEAAAYHCGKPDTVTPPPPVAGSFNEAAAYHCGKRRRLIARRHPDGGFNEAAAYHCGKPATSSPAPSAPRCCFNEAAAYHCGKPPHVRRARLRADPLQ